MNLSTLKSRLDRLEAKRGTGRFDHLSYEELEAAIFERMHRLVTAAGGIEQLFCWMDNHTDPKTQESWRKVQTPRRDLRADYLRWEGRFCSAH
jgi:hypothetical protein